MIDSVKNAITPSKTRRILSLALCAACVILFVLGAVNLPGKTGDKGLKQRGGFQGSP